MYEYSVIQWLFFFYFYCFVGWCIESVYVSAHKKHWVNRGFMRGPFLPLYGSGAIMMLVVSMPFQEQLPLVYVAGCIGATALEYVTGVTMEALFKVRYWDYSDKKFNFQGHICLGTSLAWGLLTILMTRVVHRPVERLVLAIPGSVLTVLTLVLTVAIACDFALSFKAAMDLRDILVMMEKAKEEMLHIQKRLDVIIALADSDLQARREEWNETKENWIEASEVRKAAAAQQRARIGESVTVKAAELKAGIEEKFADLKQRAMDKPSAYLESVREEIGELRVKYHINVHGQEGDGRRRRFCRSLIRSNPSMTSKVFKDVWEDLKKYTASESEEEE
ncbi:MAG: putative ABC transporter permease [bacterium]|nr:putative ABC transporter permease [bacterium]MCM1375856.1 putative ABC transporter permease [Muribaculum sp.]